MTVPVPENDEPCAITERWWTAYEQTKVRVIVHGVETAAVDFFDPDRFSEPVFVITACNPCSEPLDLDTNQRRNAELRRFLGALDGPGVTVFEAIGESADPTDPWSEPGFAVVGLTHAAARDLGRCWRQAAIFEVQGGRRRVVACFDVRDGPWLDW